MFKDLAYLQTGSEIQRCAFKAIMDLGIMETMSHYQPVLCGTIPIGINVADSDLDIIMQVEDFPKFHSEVVSHYGSYAGFQIKEKIIRNTPTIKANFDNGGFNFELFGQPQAVENQNAYRHMLVEHQLLLQYPHIQSEIIRLKEQGIKTEPAFAQVLGIEGDPYDQLLVLGREMGVI